MLILNWLKDNLFSQTALFLGLIVAVGLMLQKKSIGDILKGFISATLGYYIFNTGAGSIGGLAMVMGNLLRPTRQPLFQPDLHRSGIRHRVHRAADHHLLYHHMDRPSAAGEVYKTS